MTVKELIQHLQKFDQSKDVEIYNQNTAELYQVEDIDIDYETGDFVLVIDEGV